MPIRLYIGNLPKELERQELEAVFAESQSATLSTKIITDRKTGKCRGFGFVTVQTDEQADQLIEQFNGFMLKDSSIKIEKALPRSKGNKGNEDPGAVGEVGNGAAATSGGRKKGNKARRTSVNTNDNESFQPDPRWADQLALLKERLAATSANS
jgi:RNA recognition motif-containing protein